MQALISFHWNDSEIVTDILLYWSVFLVASDRISTYWIAHRLPDEAEIHLGLCIQEQYPIHHWYYSSKSTNATITGQLGGSHLRAKDSAISASNEPDMSAYILVTRPVSLPLAKPHVAQFQIQVSRNCIWTVEPGSLACTLVSSDLGMWVRIEIS